MALANSVKDKMAEAKALALKEPEILEEDDPQFAQKATAKNTNASRFSKK